MNKKIIEKLKNIEVFLFDFDGTLIDTEPSHIKAHNAVLSELLHKPFEFDTKEFVTKYGGKSDNEIYELYKKDFNLEYNSKEMINKKMEYSSKFLEESGNKIFDYFFELAKNKKDKRFYIFSNSYSVVINKVLDNQKVGKYIDKIFSLPELKITKTEFLENLQKYIDVKNKKVVVFEDNVNTLLLAKKLGFEIVGVESESNKGRLDFVDNLLKY